MDLYTESLRRLIIQVKAFASLRAIYDTISCSCDASSSLIYFYKLVTFLFIIEEIFRLHFDMILILGLCYVSFHY